MTGMTDAPQSRSFYPTPSCLIVALLVVECLLWLSDRFQWPTWHKIYPVLIAVASVAVVFVVMLLWLVVAVRFHWRFQFSVRSLLIFTVAVAIPFSWLAVEMKAAREQKAVIKAIEKVGGFVAWGPPNAPGWLRDVFGNDFIGSVFSVNFNQAEITDSDMEHVKVFTHVRSVMVRSAKVTDTGLRNLEGLSQLQHLVLQVNVTDKGLEHIKGLSQLQMLILSGPQITDKGLEHIKGLSQLQMLTLSGPQITDEGVKKLQQELPNCQIVHLYDHTHP